jgi:flagellar protein FlgJ
LKDYAKFVKNSSRYENAVKQGSSIKGYAEGLQNGGYATDPNYAKKIQRIASGELLNTIISNNAGNISAEKVGRG